MNKSNLKYFPGETAGQPQTLARTLFFPGNTGQPTFSSFKTESKPGLESSVIHSLDSSSVLSHLLKDSLMTKLEPGVSEGQQSQPVVDENLNICKYYF